MFLSKTVEFDAGHRVAGHNGLCCNPHGHRYRVEIEAEGIPQADGMIVDFGIVKQAALAQFVNEWDHAFLVDVKDSELWEALHGHGWRVVAFPKPPTAEHIAEEVGFRMSTAVNGQGFTISSVTVWETPTSKAVWRACD